MRVGFFWLLVWGGGLCSAQVENESSQPDLKIQSQINQYSPDGRNIYQGLVRIQYGSIFLMTADECVLHTEKETIEANGNVKMDLTTQEGLVEIVAQEAYFDIGSESGYFLGVAVTFADELFFVGERLEILQGGELLLIEDGVLTACNQPNPQWSMKIKGGTIKREGYAVIRGAKFLVKGTPLLYLPYGILPAMQERRTGLLQPDTGRSSRNGSFLSLPFYWAPRADMDLTLVPTYFDKAGLRLDVEARYHTSEHVLGNLTGALFRDKVISRLGANAPVEDGDPLKEDRFRLHFDHDQKIKKGHLQFRVEEGSDFSVDRDYLQNATKTRLREYFGRVRLDRDFGYDHLSVDVHRLRRILVDEDEVVGVTKLPSIRYHQLNRPIGAGFYYRSQLHFDRFDLNDLGPLKLDEALVRYGLEAEVSRPLSLGSFFHARWGAQVRTAVYDREKGSNEQPLADGDVMRAFGFFDLVGPRFRKYYDKEDRRRYHDLELGLNFRYGNEDEDPFLDRVRLDELDLRLFQPGKGLATAWRVNSRLFGGKMAALRPLMEMEIRQEIRFDDEIEPDNGPIETRMRLFNLSSFYANGVLDYNPDEGKLETLTFYTSVNRGGWSGYGGYVRRNTGAIDGRETFIGISDLQLPRWRSRLRVALDYDIAQGDVKSQEFLYGYQGQCLGIAFNYVRSPFDSSREGQKDFFQITLSLRNLSDIGTKF